MPQETRKSPPLTLADVTHIAQEELLARGSHVPTVIIEGDQHTVAARIEPIASTREGRAQQMFFLGFSLAQSGEVGVLHQVFFISEAWLSRSETGKPLEQPPSQDPQ